MTGENIGETEICKWKDNKLAAYSVGGDDSLRSQLYFAIPEMDKRLIRGTWWVNPGRGGSRNYKNEDDAWANCWIACYEDWKAAAARGHDFANHTLHHLGAMDYASAEDEIRQTAQAIWDANPRQRLQLFDKGGGTVWGIPDEKIAVILAEYDCVWGRGGGTEDPTWGINLNAGTLRSYVDRALREGSWHHVAFHGIGPNCEWGGQKDGKAFIALLDYLEEKRKQVWCGTHTEIHKYDQERSTAEVQLLDITSEEIRVRLTSAKDSRLYDTPLTLRTCLPESWERARITQGGLVFEGQPSAAIIQYEAVPGGPEIRIARA